MSTPDGPGRRARSVGDAREGEAGGIPMLVLSRPVGVGKSAVLNGIHELLVSHGVSRWGTKCTEGENDDLNLYARKQWAGMFTGYYPPRWEAFFAALNRSLGSGAAFDRKPYAVAMCAWEQRWSAGHGSFATAPRGDARGGERP